MYSGFKDNVCWWEALVMLRKALVATVVTTSKDMPFFQTFFAGLLLQIFVFVHLQMHPYRDNVINLLETASLTVTSITLTGSLVFYTHPPPACKSDADRDFLGPSTPGQRESFSLRSLKRPGWDDVPSVISVVMAVANIGLVLMFAYMIVVDVWKLYKLKRSKRNNLAESQARAPGQDLSQKHLDLRGSEKPVMMMSDESMLMHQGDQVDDIFRKGDHDITVNPIFGDGSGSFESAFFTQF